MMKRSSINWKAVADELERAPDNFLQAASKLWLGRLAGKQRQPSQKSGKKVLGDNLRKDAEQQARWKAAHDSAVDELLYSGKFKDKGEHIQLLQHVRVVNRTAKQIHIVAAYTLYYSSMRNNSGPVAWSTSQAGGLFGNFYTGWKPVTRYRLRRVPKANLYNPEVLEIPGSGKSGEERNVHMQEWKHLCGVCLFANEGEYAEWHLVRYEDTMGNIEAPHLEGSEIRKAPPESHTMLGLSVDASQTEIKAAYKRMAMKHHPDRGGNATEFRKVRVAYEVLSDNKRG